MEKSFFKQAELLIVFRAVSNELGGLCYLVFQFSSDDWGQTNKNLDALTGLKFFLDKCLSYKATKEKYRDLKLLGFQWIDHPCTSLLISVRAERKSNFVSEIKTRCIPLQITLPDKQQNLKLHLNKVIREELLTYREGYRKVRLAGFQFLP